MRNSRIRILAEMGLTIALFAILQAIPAFKMPYGGSVSLAMVPIVILALLRGPVVGVICGALCGVVDLMFEPYLFHPAQVVLDYPLAYALVGFSGLLSTFFKKSMQEGKKLLSLLTIGGAVAIGVTSRLLSHVLSGVIFFSEYAPETQNVWLYSLIYNGTYLLPSLIAVAAVALVVVPILYKNLDWGNDKN